jgi:hypothetical protein
MSENLNQNFKEGFYKAASVESERRNLNKRMKRNEYEKGPYSGKYKKSFLPSAKKYVDDKAGYNKKKREQFKDFRGKVFGTLGGMAGMIGGVALTRGKSKGKLLRNVGLGTGGGALAGRAYARGPADRKAHERNLKRQAQAKSIKRIKDKKSREDAIAKMYARSY